MKFIIIGITDHPNPSFTPAVAEVIKNGKFFSGGKRHHEIVSQLLPSQSKWIDISVPLDDVFREYEKVSSTPSGMAGIVVFASGDPLFYGFAVTLRRRFPHAEMQLFPSFNSLQQLAHASLVPYHDLRVVSLTGRPWDDFDRSLIERCAKIGVLTDREHTPSAIASRMLEFGCVDYEMIVGERMGNPQEQRVSTLSLPEVKRMDFSFPNCLILRQTTTERRYTPFGLPDEKFCLLDGRSRMITKMPIRLLTLQALELPRRRVFWDVGFCTGSVSIEARLQFPHLHIDAFEIRPECESIIEANMRRFGAPGISVHMGDFCKVRLEEILPHQRPDAVFVGGHGGRLREVFSILVRCVEPGGVVVMNSVTQESRQAFSDICREFALREFPPTRISLNDYNPITILKCELPL